MLKGIDHVAIAVADLEAALAKLETAWGLKPSHRERVDDQGVEEVMVPVGDSQLQLLGALGPETTVGKFLAHRGEGLHHIAIAVDDIEATLQQLKAQGLALIDEKPRPGGRGLKIAFVHPKGNLGVLVELVQAD